MQDDTIKLLMECNLGCKMAVNSLNQISDFVTNPDLANLIEKSIAQHEQIGNDTSRKLDLAGAQEKEPGAMTSAFSWNGKIQCFSPLWTDSHISMVL